MAQRPLAFYINPDNPRRTEVMRAIAEAGLKYIGTDGFGWDLESEQHRYEAFRAECDDFGLSVYSAHAMVPILETADSDTSSPLMEAHRGDLRRIAAVGGKTAVYHACALSKVPVDHEDEAIEKAGIEAFKQRCVRALGQLAEEAAKHGIVVVVENIWHSKWSRSVHGFIDMVQMADRPNVGLLVDSGHAHLCRLTAADEIRAAGKLLEDTHFHDNFASFMGEAADLHLPPGMGTIDWVEVCRALDEIEFPGPVTFEGVFGPADDQRRDRFGGRLSYAQVVNMTVSNWRGFEAIAAGPLHQEQA